MAHRPSHVKSLSSLAPLPAGVSGRAGVLPNSRQRHVRPGTRMGPPPRTAGRNDPAAAGLGLTPPRLASLRILRASLRRRRPAMADIRSRQNLTPPPRPRPRPRPDGPEDGPASGDGVEPN